YRSTNASIVVITNSIPAPTNPKTESAMGKITTMSANLKTFAKNIDRCALNAVNTGTNGVTAPLGTTANNATSRSGIASAYLGNRVCTNGTLTISANAHKPSAIPIWSLIDALISRTKRLDS